MISITHYCSSTGEEAGKHSHNNLLATTKNTINLFQGSKQNHNTQLVATTLNSTQFNSTLNRPTAGILGLTSKGESKPSAREK